jgi:guanine deaminase
MSPSLQVIRAPLCNPRPDGGVDYFADGVLAADERGTIAFAGPWEAFVALAGDTTLHARLDGLVVPAMFDLHTHVPQHPIRGRFSDGVDPHDSRGVLLASLEKNVFPAERTWQDADHAEAVAGAFVADARRNGVIGGCAFLTVHAAAAERVMTELPPTWHAGLVLMDQNCPTYLRNDAHAIADTRRLGERFGRRYVVTDRFAVANSTAQRRAAAEVARDLGLMTQTHLNEQLLEKRLVERTLYPQHASYTHLYADDNFLDTRAVLAHCVQMTPPEWQIVAEKRCVVAHCPTSNARLGSGVMDLDAVAAHGIDYAICTDVGASGTTSLLAEMAMFLIVHAGRSARATACEALYRATLAPACALGLGAQFGGFAVGKKLAYVELAPPPAGERDAEKTLRAALLPRSILSRLPSVIGTATPPPLADLVANGAAINMVLAQHESSVRSVASPTP